MLFVLLFVGAFAIAKNVDRVLKSMTNVTVNYPVLYDVKRFIELKCRTYVREFTPSRNKPIPAVKVPDSLPDFAVVGISFIHRDDLADINLDSISTFDGMPDCFKKQFIGNLNIDEAFQDAHEKWEHSLWTNIMRGTRNYQADMRRPTRQASRPSTTPT